MKKGSVNLVIILSVLLVLLTLLIQTYSQTVPRWWGWLVGGVDTLAEDGILTSVVAVL